MNRYVRRGAKGIALLDESSGFPRLYCIFDVSDTGVVPLAAAMQKGANMNTNSRNVTYSTVGDYQLPNLTLNQPLKPLGKYGRLRRTYLKDHRPVLYNTMLLNGSLYPHLMEVEQTAENRMQQTVAQLLKQNSAPDKEQNQMAWVQHMNSLKAQAEELVLTELIYS